MLHGPATPVGKDPAGPYKQRLGIWMFFFYALFYAGFVAINLLNPLAMGAIVFAGLNLATVYGIALILVAFIQALVYDAMCRKKEAELENEAPSQSKKASKPQSAAGNKAQRSGKVPEAQRSGKPTSKKPGKKGKA